MTDDLHVPGSLTIGDASPNPSFNGIIVYRHNAESRIPVLFVFDNEGDGTDHGTLQVICRELKGFGQSHTFNAKVVAAATPEAVYHTTHPNDPGNGYLKHPIESCTALQQGLVSYPNFERYGLGYAHERSHWYAIGQSYPDFPEQPTGDPANSYGYFGGTDGAEFLFVAADELMRPLIVMRLLDPIKPKTDPSRKSPRIGIGCDPAYPLDVKRLYNGFTAPIARFSGDNTQSAPNQILVTADNTLHGLAVGYHTGDGGEYGALDASVQGVGPAPTVLNPSGGAVGVGTVPAAGTKLHVAGKLRVDGATPATAGAVVSHLVISVNGTDYAIDLRSLT